MTLEAVVSQGLDVLLLAWLLFSDSTGSEVGLALALPMKVLFTVDTEFWPRNPGFAKRAGREPLDPTRYMRRDIYGVTERGDFGLPFQMELLRSHGLRGIFFVESLFASATSMKPLREVVALIQDAGHEVQLHLHTEWLGVTLNPIVRRRHEVYLRDFTLEEQRKLLTHGLENLRGAGAKSICAYRAGSFGANTDTLRALADIGIPFDSSYNAAYLASSCGIKSEEPVHQPIQIEGVWEIPVSCFEDLPGHVRPVQIGACSTAELKHALLEAWKAEWSHFVLVTHSNEILKRRGDGPNPIVLNRYRELCRFLGENQDKFVCTTFDEIAAEGLSPNSTHGPISSNALRTAGRFGEQLAQRFLF